MRWQESPAGAPHLFLPMTPPNPGNSTGLALCTPFPEVTPRTRAWFRSPDLSRISQLLGVTALGAVPAPPPRRPQQGHGEVAVVWWCRWRVLQAGTVTPDLPGCSFAGAGGQGGRGEEERV